MASPLRTLDDGPASTLPRPRVVIVGLGRAARFTLDALRDLPVQIVAGVDPLSRDAKARLPAAIPVFASLADVSPSLEFELAIVATPTPLHVEVCLDVLEQMPFVRRILCEKPLATDCDLVSTVLDRADATGVSLEVLYHYGYAPEVEWLATRWHDFETTHGSVTGLSARFDDPKESLSAASTTLVSSWADSGINALSVLARFVNLGRISRTSRGAPNACDATVEYESGGHRGEGSITTSWTAPKICKRTALTLTDGTTVTMNHANGTVATTNRTRSKLIYCADATSLPHTRYRRMHAEYVAGGSAVFDRALTLRLHELLAQGFESNA